MAMIAMILSLHIFAVAGTSASSASAAPRALTSTTTVKFLADADAHIDSTNPTTNFGSQTLRTQGGGQPQLESYLRFTVFGVTGVIQSAALRVYASNGTVDGPALYAASSSWNESDLTWNTRPINASNTSVSDKGQIATGSWVDYPVTRLVTGNGSYNFRFAATSTDGIDFNSREEKSPPQLVLTVNGSTTSDVEVTVDRSTADVVSRMGVGATHIAYSLDPDGDDDSIARGRDLLSQAALYQNQSIMGFGVASPEPAPGVYDWYGLDRRVKLMQDTGGIPTLTLFGAPTWMVDPNWVRGTNWDKAMLEKAPLPEHYDEFAELARRTAIRYKGIVKHYFVWNEMKGFWNPKTQNWNMAAYTTMYNKVYDALKSVDPAIQVGGPYIVIEGTGTETGQWFTEMPLRARNVEAIQYWLDHKHGADFLAVDRKIQNMADTNTYSKETCLSLTRLFGTVTDKLQALTGGLPVWYVESYFKRDDADPQYEAVGMASMLYHQLQAGATVSLRWGPQRQPVGIGGGTGQSLFTDTAKPGGGQPLPAFYVYKAFKDHFGPGTQTYATTSSSPDVEVLASANRTLLINKRPTAITVLVNHTLITLQRYEVRVI